MDSTDELEAMRRVAASLDPLEEGARARIIAWATAKYGARTYSASATASAKTWIETAASHAALPSDFFDRYGSLGEFFDAVDPGIESEKVLVVGLWMQKQSGMDTFDAAVVNLQLKSLGHGVSNITSAFNDLIARNPALAMQTEKSGRSQQARKKYKITSAGEKAVTAMIIAKANAILESMRATRGSISNFIEGENT